MKQVSIFQKSTTLLQKKEAEYHNRLRVQETFLRFEDDSFVSVFTEAMNMGIVVQCAFVVLLVYTLVTNDVKQSRFLHVLPLGNSIYTNKIWLFLVLVFCFSMISTSLTAIIIHQMCPVDVSTMIQSFVLFQNFTVPMSILTYVFLFAVVSFFSYAMAGSVLMLLYTVVRNQGRSFLMFLALYFIEYLISLLVSTNGVFSILKYANLFSMLNIQQIFFQDQYIPMLGNIITSKHLFILLCIFLILMLFLGKKASQRVEGFQVKKKFEWQVRLPYPKTMLGFELNKHLIHKKLLLICLLVLSFQIYRIKDYDYYRLEDARMLELYIDRYEGIITAEKEKEIEELYDSINTMNSRERQGTERFYDYYQQLKNQNQKWIVYSANYDLLFGKEQNYDSSMSMLTAISLMIIMLSGIYVDEKKNQRDLFIQTFRKEKKYHSMKIISMIIMTAIIFIISYLPFFLKAAKIHSFTCIQAPVSSLQIPFLQNDWSIFWNLVYVFMNDFLILMIAALWIGVSSYIGKKKSHIYGCFIAMLLCPILLDMLGFPQILSFVFTKGMHPQVLYQEPSIWLWYLGYSILPIGLWIRKRKQTSRGKLS